MSAIPPLSLTKDRRRYRVFVTLHTEYHLCHDLVVAARPRGTATFDLAHAALGLTLCQAPAVGFRLWFQDTRGAVLLTSPLVAVERPPLWTVLQYPSARRLAARAER